MPDSDLRERIAREVNRAGGNEYLAADLILRLLAEREAVMSMLAASLHETIVDELGWTDPEEDRPYTVRAHEALRRYEQQERVPCLTREDAERLLRYFRGYWLLRDAEGRHVPVADRLKYMPDDAIKAAVDEFVVFNSEDDPE